jgi:hypothetical protein
MNLIDPANDWNLKALALGGLLLLTCLLIQVFVIHYVGQAFRRFQKDSLKMSERWMAQVNLLAGAILLMLTHLLHIYIWGYALYMMSVIEVLKTAIIFAGSTYTTVGFVNDPLPAEWQLLAVTMATSGLFSFGMSTSVMFVLAQRIFSQSQKST